MEGIESWLCLLLVEFSAIRTEVLHRKSGRAIPRPNRAWLNRAISRSTLSNSALGRPDTACRLRPLQRHTEVGWDGDV
jgi:hypothetical protein